MTHNLSTTAYYYYGYYWAAAFTRGRIVTP